MASPTVADFIVERLHAWGVHRVYGYPGDGIGGVIAALPRAPRTRSFVQVRHEETAGFAAGATSSTAAARSAAAW